MAEVDTTVVLKLNLAEANLLKHVLDFPGTYADDGLPEEVENILTQLP